MRKLIITVLLVLLFINFVYVLSGAYHLSLRSVDVYAIWMYKAKIFFVNDGAIIESLYQLEQGHPQYPILLSYFFYWIFKITGGVNEIFVFLLYPVIYVTILYLSYKVFRKVGISVTISLLFVYIYSMFGPLLAQAGRYHAGTADIFIVLINWLIVYLSLLFFTNKKKELLPVIIALLIGISSLIKLEGVFFVSVLLFLPMKFKAKSALIFIAVLPAILWQYIRSVYAIPTSFELEIPSVFQIIERSPEILYLTIKEMLNLNNWYIFWPMLFLVFIQGDSKNKFLYKILIPAATLSFLAFIAIYLASSIPPSLHTPSSIDRVLFQLSPFIFTSFVLQLNIFIQKKLPHDFSRNIF